MTKKKQATKRVKKAKKSVKSPRAQVTRAQSLRWRKVPIEGALVAERTELPNGLRVIFVPRRLAPVFSYQTWFNVGSRDEDPKYSGMAHLFEHMMFKATKGRKPGEFDRLMESNGARDLNAFTSTDYTAYVQSLPKEAFPMVAQLESERMHSLLINNELFQAERQVVHNERKERTDNNPEGRMYEELAKLAFQKHPYGWPVIGFAEDLDRMQPADLERFYQRFYAPNNAVIVVVGDLNRAQVEREIVRRYGAFAAVDAQRFQASPEPEQTQERRTSLELTIQVEKLYAAYKIPAAKHPDLVPLLLLSGVLSTGRSSRLYQGLVDTGLAVEASAGPMASKDPALFYVYLAAHAGKSVEASLQAFDAIIEKIISKGIAAEELHSIRNKFKTGF